MRSQRSVVILLAVAAVLAAAANLGGNVVTDQLPPDLQTNALRLFALATLVELIATILLDRLEKVERTLRRQVLAVGLIGLGAAAATLGGLVSNSAAAALPEVIRPFILPNVVPVLIVVTILTIVVAVALYRLSGTLRLTSDNRKAFLSKVCQRYTNRMSDALGEAARIDLHLREDAQAITQPTLAQQYLGDGKGAPEQERPLPPGTRIDAIYDAAQEELLILGEPGAGKTTLLVQLAMDLVGRAETSKQLKMPVIFSLASWKVKRQPLQDWMAEQLTDIYQVPHKVAAAWIEKEEVLPLLDGLDEVADEHRASCAAIIEEYHGTHERVPLVVCSRISEYFALPERLHLRTAVVVQPLTDEQIEDYLEQGRGLDGLRDALAGDTELRSAVRTPLMLSVMALAYQGLAGDAIPRVGDEKAWRRRLFETYVARMYHRQRGMSEVKKGQAGYDRRHRSQRKSGGTKQPSYTLQQTIHYLSWLASQMKAQQLTDAFYFERLQPEWLPDKQEQIAWLWSARVASGVLAGIVVGVGAGLGIGVGTGLGIGLLAAVDGALLTATVVISVRTDVGLVLGMLAGLVAGLGLELARGPSDGFSDLVIHALAYGAIAGAMADLVYLLAVRLVGPLSNSAITLTWAVWWSWRAIGSALYGLIVGLGSALFIVLATELMFDLVSKLGLTLELRPDDAFTAGLACGATVGLTVAVTVGASRLFANASVDERDLTVPNYGQSRSLRFGLTAMLVVMVVVGVTTAIATGLISQSVDGRVLGIPFGATTGLPAEVAVGLSAGLVVGPAAGLVIGLRYGLRAYIQHSFLLRSLIRRGCMSAHPVEFLEFAADRVMLQRVGGGYRFIHDLLLSYFAGQGAESDGRESNARLSPHVPDPIEL